MGAMIVRYAVEPHGCIQVPILYGFYQVVLRFRGRDECRGFLRYFSEFLGESDHWKPCVRKKGICLYCSVESWVLVRSTCFIVRLVSALGGGIYEESRKVKKAYSCGSVLAIRGCSGNFFW